MARGDISDAYYALYTTMYYKHIPDKRFKHLGILFYFSGKTIILCDTISYVVDISILGQRVKWNLPKKKIEVIQ